jgi:5'-deoxynucleotidase YfbR-like HD superfamily hydrolase
VARWNGQTVGEHAFSVAQHSIVVHDIAVSLNPRLARRWRLAALLHDAPEYVVGDLISPFKAALGIDYKAFELRLLAAIHQRFGLPAVLPTSVLHAVKVADRIAAYYEATRLAGFAVDEALRYFGTPPALGCDCAGELDRLAAVSTAEGERRFLFLFRHLSA